MPSDPSITFNEAVKNWGEQWINKGEIAEPFLDCILNSKARPGRNYGLIKTHKPGNPIRLITSGIGTAVENLSAFTEYFLYPCVRKEPQILLDTTALLNTIENINRKFGPFPEGTLLVSWNAISRYPNINNEMGISARKKALDKRTTLSPSTECLLEAIKIRLNCNNSSFNDKHYRQNRVTAMGPHNSCRYADLAMTEIDHKILHHDDRPNDLVFPPDWSRFRDDRFSAWFRSHDDLVRFTDWLTSVSPSIKFTVKHSDQQLQVSDTLLCIINGRIESKVYSKPTDGHMY